MATDYPVIKESSEYVRGVLTDHIMVSTTLEELGSVRRQDFSFFCHHCGESTSIRRDGCHTHCFNCGATSEGCGD